VETRNLKNSSVISICIAVLSAEVKIAGNSFASLTSSLKKSVSVRHLLLFPTNNEAHQLLPVLF